MVEERLREVLRLCEEALSRDGGEREAYLAGACGADAGLRQEVETLLSERFGASGDFLESPPWLCTAPTLSVGERLGPYEVIAPPRRGGMGAVYRARDTRLGRSVALKVLGGSSDMALAARDRFKREARAIASLDHPNICALYDVGSARHGGPGGQVVDYLVMEYLDGQTLHERLAPREGAPESLPAADALEFAVQIADALVAAHQAGIAHRDLKPSNIMLVPGSAERPAQAKLLDFGLAKHVALEDPAAETSAADSVTGPGTVLGTLGYHSPEQARGEHVDARTDLFAFGAVLFEMLTGRPAFTRGSAADTIAAVLHDRPPNPSALNPAVPPACDAIVEKALQKDRALRYQSAAEIRADLRRAQLGLLVSGSSDASQSAHGSRGVRRWWQTSRRNRIAASAAGIVILAAAVAIAFELSGTAGVPAFTPSLLTPGNGVESEPTFSPDGTMVAYTAEIEGNQDVLVFDRRSRATSNLTRNPAADRHASWLPDGGTLLFVSDRSGEPAIWRIPTVGGSPTQVLANADDVAVSRDGRRIAFTRSVEGAGRIFVAQLGDSPAVVQITRRGDGPGSHVQPAWAPDGKTLAYIAHGQVWVVPLSGGIARRVGAGNDFEADPAWSSDGLALYYSSTREGGQAIWRAWAGKPPIVDRLMFWRPGGPLRVSRSLGSEQQPALSRDGRFLTFSTLQQDTNLAFFDVQDGREVPWGTLQNETFPTLAPDRRRVYFVSQADPPFSQLWGLDLQDGRPAGRPQRLTSHSGHVSHPACSPDGKWVAYFVGESDGVAPGNVLVRIWVAPAFGGTAVPVSDGPYDALPAWSPNGDAIVYVTEVQGRGDIWTVPVKGGKRAGPPVRVTTGSEDDDAPVWSPDGALIAFRRSSSAVPGRMDVWVVRPNGTGEAQVTNAVWAERMAWDPSTPGAVLVAGRWAGRASGFELRRISREPGRPVPPLPPIQMDMDGLTDFSVSGDARLIVFSRYSQKGNIWLWTAAGRGTF